MLQVSAAACRPALGSLAFRCVCQTDRDGPNSSPSAYNPQRDPSSPIPLYCTPVGHRLSIFVLTTQPRLASGAPNLRRVQGNTARIPCRVLHPTARPGRRSVAVQRPEPRLPLRHTTPRLSSQRKLPCTRSIRYQSQLLSLTLAKSCPNDPSVLLPIMNQTFGTCLLNAGRIGSPVEFVELVDGRA